MKIQTGQMQGRRGWKLDNGVLSLFVMEGGGHIAGLGLTGLKPVNPFWSPAWKTIEPWQYRKDDASRFECRLLACIYGHNLCLGAFGEPSKEEARVGMETHGEAPVARWRCARKRVGRNRLSFSYGCELKIVRMKIVRTITLEAGSSVVHVVERLSNTARCDMPFTMCQHVTFGPPFLEPGVTMFDMSGTKGRTFPGEFSRAQRMKSASDFSWPVGPGRRGKIDLRFMGSGKNSDFASVEMDRNRDHAWFSAVNPRLGLMVAYLWNRSDYPWTCIWEEAFARDQNPWKGKTLARGMEFSNSPFPVGLRGAVDMGSLRGQPTFRWLGALSSQEFKYSILAVPVDSDCKGVADIKSGRRGLEIDLIV